MAGDVNQACCQLSTHSWGYAHIEGDIWLVWILIYAQTCTNTRVGVTLDLQRSNLIFHRIMSLVATQGSGHDRGSHTLELGYQSVRGPNSLSLINRSSTSSSSNWIDYLCTYYPRWTSTAKTRLGNGHQPSSGGLEEHSHSKIDEYALQHWLMNGPCLTLAYQTDAWKTPLIYACNSSE